MKNLLKLILSVGISFAILSMLLNMVTSGLNDQERPSVLSALQNTEFRWVLVALLVYLITLMIRALRYQLLIRISGEENTPTLKQMVMVTGIRNMIVDMLPARMGELGYIGLLNKGYGVKLQHCASSLAISIAFDFLALLVVVMLIVLKQLTGSDGVQGWAYGALITACILSAVAFAGLYYITPAITPILKNKLSNKQPDSLINKGILFLESFNESLIMVKKSGKTKAVLLLSVVIRLLKYTGFYCLFMAVTIPSFSSLAELPTEQVISALIGGEIAASLPTPTFMSFGAYEAGGALVFQLLGIKDQVAGVITLLGVHIWSQLMEYTIGGIFLAVFILLTRASKSEKPSLQRKVGIRLAMLAAAGMVFMAGTGFLAYELRAAKKMGSITAPKSGDIALGDMSWQEQSKLAIEDIDGFVVWSSNRNGNHDIYKMSLPDMGITNLTNHPHTETYARISPNGKKLVFSRSHQPWVSQRNVVAWDVFLLDLDTGNERKLSVNSTSAKWVSDNEVTYLQDATTIVKLNINTGAKETLFQPSVGNNMPKGSNLQNPAYNPKTGQVVFTARQNQIGMNTGHWGTAVYKNKQLNGVYDGCELSFSSDYNRMFQMATAGGNQGTQIVSIDTETLAMTPWIDLDGEFSHEYWPKESSDGEYLVFGASRSRAEHEHDTKDYELFVWKKGSASNKATRLTFHSGNDNWPDMFVNP